MKKVFIITAFLLCTVPVIGQYTNVRLNNPASTDPEEVSIAINPANPDIIAAGANIQYFYYSTNAGQTWTQKLMSSSLGVWGDPSLIFDGLGYLYFGHLSNPLNGYWIDRIVVQRSTDNGITFNEGAGIGLQYPKNQDKEWLAVDMSTPQYKNFVYAAWTEFDNYGSYSSLDSSRILFSRSTDHGITWSPAKRVSDKGGNCVDEDFTVEGAVPSIGPNGEIFIAWSGPLGIMFDKSTNGGNSFGTDIYVADQPGGWDFTVPGISRCNGLPVTVCDTSYASTRGNIYVLWGDQRYGYDNSDVFVCKSTNAGNSWGPFIKVNNDNTTRHQFFPWLTIDQTTGFLYAVFYDRRNTAGLTTDVYVARSTDAGETWDNFKVNQSSFTPNSGVFFGDYTNIAAYNRKIYPVWMRLDNSTLSVWSAIISDTTMVPVELKDFTATALNGKVYLTWITSSEKNNQGFIIEKMHVTENPGQWRDAGFVSGNGTTTEFKSYSWSEVPEESGIYYYRLKQIDYDGRFKYSKTLEVSVQSDFSFDLMQNYPNPFNPATTISYRIPVEEEVTLKVFDVLGNEVALLEKGLKQPGVHEVEFHGDKLVSGIYIYKLVAGEYNAIRKMMLVK